MRYGTCIPVQPTDAETDINTEFEVIAAMLDIDAEYEALVAEHSFAYA